MDDSKQIQLLKELLSKYEALYAGHILAIHIQDIIVDIKKIVK